MGVFIPLLIPHLRAMARENAIPERSLSGPRTQDDGHPPSWDLFGLSLGCFGSLLGLLGRFLGPLGGLSGCLAGLLGRPGAVLGRPGAILDRLGAVLGRLGVLELAVGYQTTLIFLSVFLYF